MGEQNTTKKNGEEMMRKERNLSWFEVKIQKKRTTTDCTFLSYEILLF